MGTDTTPGLAGRSQPYGSGSVLAGTLPKSSSSGDACGAECREVRSIGYESDKIAHKLHKPLATVRRINRAGLDAIAAGLRRDDVAVF